MAEVTEQAFGRIVLSPVLRHSSTSETDIKLSDEFDDLPRPNSPDSMDEEEEDNIAPLLDQLSVPALPDLDTIHSLHSQRKSNSASHAPDEFGFGIRKRTRLSTLAGYSVNHMTLLKLQLDEGNWLTIQVTPETRGQVPNSNNNLCCHSMVSIYGQSNVPERIYLYIDSLVQKG